MSGPRILAIESSCDETGVGLVRGTTHLGVGQEAVAMGSPLALTGGPSVTVGIISGLHRSVTTRTGHGLLDMVQTDAPIAPGSSGGALLDSGGRVIGITTAVAMNDTGAESSS